MKKTRRNVGIFTLTLIFLFTSVFQSFAIDLEKQQELKDFGKVINVLLRHDMVFVDNPLLEEYLNTIIKKVSDVNEFSYQYHVKVVNDFMPNSFSGPDGTIYITTGLLDIIQNEYELAFVLSHEIAHINNQDMFNTFLDIKSKRTKIITGGIILASILMVVTVGASAAAMGPMGTATASSTMITSIGTIGSSAALGTTLNPPKFEGLDNIKEFSKVRLGKVGISTEGEHHPVYAPALFGALMQGIYTGYGQEKETETNNIALEIYSKTAFKTDGGKNLASRFSDKIPDVPQSHFESFLKELNLIRMKIK